MIRLPYTVAKASYVFSLVLLLLPFLSIGQTTSHNKTWYFGHGNTLQFTPSGPVPNIGIPTPVPANLYGLHSGVQAASIAVNDVTGNLQFFVQIRSLIEPAAAQAYVNNTPKVFDRMGAPMPQGNIEANLSTGGNGIDINPLVVPHPAHPQQYFLFYSNNHALMYSVVDMSLNNGMGAIIPTQKNIHLTGYGRIDGRKISLVKGCSQVWLVVRSRTANEYLSFAIAEQGVAAQPTISVCGTLPLAAYSIVEPMAYMGQSAGAYNGGILKAAHNSRHLVAGTNKGIELYDFEPCSGKLKNARMLDSLPVLGLCFSPDDTKLYSSQLDRECSYVDRGKVYQYAFDAQATNSTLLSKTLILENPLLYWTGWNTHTSGFIGDIKEGPDQKLYMSSNQFFFFSGTPQPTPPATTVMNQQSIHVIHQPNQSGVACQAETDVHALLGARIDATGFMLPQDIIIANTIPPDTLMGGTFSSVHCFAQSALLQADTTGACYLWDDGSMFSSRQVDSSGTYWVRYQKECSVVTDTFVVRFIALPEVPQLQYGCPQDGVIAISQATNDTTTYHYTLQNANGLSQQAYSSIGHRFGGLTAGAYSLQIQTSGACDTTLYLQLAEYPKPTLVVNPGDTTIRYGDTIQLQVSGAYIYTWSPTAHLDTATIAKPMAWPRQPTRYEVVGINEYGCRAVAQVNIDINYDMPEFVPNAFSPNGDGLNDVFRLGGITYHKLSVFKVFNRYGQEVYSGTDPMQGWDGNSHGKPCDVGTYYYLIGLMYPDGRVKTLKGDVSLIR